MTTDSDQWRRAWVFASGEFQLSTLQGLQPQQDELIVSVDGGLRHCIDAGWAPDWLIGDMDSVTAEMLASMDTKSVRQIRFPADKDASDLELALDKLTAHRLDEVLLLGVSGGRTDHMLFNWALPGKRQWPFRIRLLDRHVDAHVVRHDQPLRINKPVGTIISLLALSATTGVTVQGLRYTMQGVTLLPGSTLGLSNVSLTEQISVTLDSGVLLAMMNLTGTSHGSHD